MKNQQTITILLSLIEVLAIAAARMGIWAGQFTVKTVRGDKVTVYREGVYKHMSAEVAP